MLKNFIVVIHVFSIMCIMCTELMLKEPLNYEITHKIKKVVIWGYKLHSHTHSYIHYAYDKAFRYLGFETYWLDDSDSITGIDFSHALFFTMGDDANINMPLREDCYYILHNVNRERYVHLFEKNRCIILQVYTHDCLDRTVTKMDECIYYDLSNLCIYMPWATDLLPHEIDEIKKQLPLTKENTVYYIGSLSGDGVFSNINQLHAFAQACAANNINFKLIQSVSNEDNIALTQKSHLGIAVQGDWQCKKGYIPCRVFKTASYGRMPVTNNPTVYELFNKKIVYNTDTYELFFDAIKREATLTIDDMHELMDVIKEKHTYINRIAHLFNFMDMVFNY